MFDRNGNGGPTVWVDGRIVGGWVQRRDGTIACGCWPTSASSGARRSTQAAPDLQELLGDVRFTVRFPAPIQAELLA